jgi:SOS response regulatory protein OraA/RecX
LSIEECRARLLERDHPADQIDKAITLLVENGSLDDARVARQHARTAVEVKGRGRLRVARELQARGIDRSIATAVIAEVFGEFDERSLVARAIAKTQRTRGRPMDTKAYARIYQHLLRQGFTPAVVAAELRKLRRNTDDES